jgi:hypothetical protein
LNKRFAVATTCRTVEQWMNPAAARLAAAYEPAASAMRQSERVVMW